MGSSVGPFDRDLWLESDRRLGRSRPSFLPPDHPHLGALKKQAKDLLRRARDGESNP
jgi:hypothetical protein